VKTLVTYETIRLEPAGDAAAGLWLLTLNRPEAMNAMNTQMYAFEQRQSTPGGDFAGGELQIERRFRGHRQLQKIQIPLI
jgi:hypothetical protein